MIEMKLEIAERAARAALAKATSLGTPMTVSVVDEAGRLVLTLKGDNTGFLTTDTSRAKAFAAGAFRRSTKEMVEMQKTNPVIWASGPAIPRGARPGSTNIITRSSFPIRRTFAASEPMRGNTCTIPTATDRRIVISTSCIT